MRVTGTQSDFAVHPTARDRVRSIAAGIFQIDAAQIDLAMGPDEIGAWDSLNHLKLITAIEDAFSVRLTMQQIQEIATLEDLVKSVSQSQD